MKLSVALSCPLALRKSHFMHIVLLTLEGLQTGGCFGFFPAYALQISKILLRK